MSAKSLAPEQYQEEAYLDKLRQRLRNEKDEVVEQYVAPGHDLVVRHERRALSRRDQRDALIQRGHELCDDLEGEQEAQQTDGALVLSLDSAVDLRNSFYRVYFSSQNKQDHGVSDEHERLEASIEHKLEQLAFQLYNDLILRYPDAEMNSHGEQEHKLHEDETA